MSGNVVAWVYAQFPAADEVSRNRKIVLSEVAESANRDFEQAHPGIGSIVAHWAFDRSTVIRHLNWLVTNGWLEVTEKGRGRGHATVYRVCKEKVALCDPSPDEKVAPASHKRSHTRDRTHTSQAISNSPEIHAEANASTEPACLPGMPSKSRALKDTDPIVGEAHEIATRVMNRQPRPAQPFLHVRSVAEACLRAEWPPAEVVALMMDPAVPLTVNALDVARARRHEHNGQDETTTVRLARLRREGKIE